MKNWLIKYRFVDILFIFALLLTLTEFLKTYKIMQRILDVSLDDFRKIVDSCFNDSLLVPALTHFDRNQISELKDFILPNLVHYCQNYGELHSLTPVSVYRHTQPIIHGEIQDFSVVLFRIIRKRSYHSFKPLYFVVFMSDFKIYRSSNLSLFNASQLYTLYVDGMCLYSRDISPDLPF